MTQTRNRDHWAKTIKRGDKLYKLNPDGSINQMVIFWCEDSFKHAPSSISPGEWYRLTDYFIGVFEAPYAGRNDYDYVDCWYYDDWLTEDEYQLTQAVKGIQTWPTS